MINPDLQPGKPVQTRSGREAVIYAVHEGQKFPIHGAYKDENGDWAAVVMYADGLVYDCGVTHPLDIIPKPKKLTGFINVYEHIASKHETREGADQYDGRFSTGPRIACIDLATLNLTEGHGLTEGPSDE